MSLSPNMSPEAINKKHGKVTWKCWGCRAETGLHWHRGWSVAMCSDSACAAAYNDMCKRQEDAEAAYLEHCKEIYG